MGRWLREWDVGFRLDPLEVAGCHNLVRTCKKHETDFGVHTPLWQHWTVVGGAQINGARVSGLQGFAMARVEDAELTAEHLQILPMSLAE